MPNETDMPELRPQDIDRILTDWQDDEYHRQLVNREAAYESNQLNERLIELSNELRQQRESSEDKPAPVFEIPASVQAELKAKREEFDRQWEIEDSKSIPRTAAGLRSDLEKEGLRAEPPTAEEVEEREVRAIRAHAAAVHKPKTRKSTTLKRPSSKRYVSPKDAGPPPHIAREMRDDSL